MFVWKESYPSKLFKNNKFSLLLWESRHEETNVNFEEFSDSFGPCLFRTLKPKHACLT